MVHHEDSDSEDDYEGYFLKPVNEYKIADKILSANKELFDEQLSEAIVQPTFGLAQQNSNSSESRRVTFRSDLEDYEPEFIIDDDYDDINDEEISESDEDFIESDNNNSSSKTEEECENVEEELIVGISEIEEKKDSLSEEEKKVNQIIQEEVATNMDTSLGGDDAEEEEVQIDEICEEIGDMDITTTTNVLPIEVEEKSIESKNESTEVNSLEDEDQSTVEDTSGQPIVKLETETTQNNNCNNITNGTKTKSIRKQISIKSLTNNNFLKIHLNFKPCCEYKCLESEKLPRYCGYISEYGLSKEQLERRNGYRERYQQRVCQRTQKKFEEKNIKSQVNEEAFSRWLRLKMKTTRTTNKNMYDYNPAKDAQNKVKKHF